MTGLRLAAALTLLSGCAALSSGPVSGSASSAAAGAAPEARPGPESAPAPPTEALRSARTAAATGPALAAAAAPVIAPGLYRCDLDRRVTVRRVSEDRATLTLQWLGRDFTLRALPDRPGTPRYESAVDGLAWFVLDGKSILLDTKKNRQLASGCKF